MTEIHQGVVAPHSESIAIEHDLRRVVGDLGGILARLEIASDLQEIDDEQRHKLSLLIGHICVRTDTIRVVISSENSTHCEPQQMGGEKCIESAGSGAVMSVIKQETASNGQETVTIVPGSVAAENSEDTGSIERPQLFDTLLTYVKSQQGQPVRPRDLHEFLPDSLSAQHKQSIVKRFFKKLENDENHGPLLHADGKTSNRTYRYQPLFGPEEPPKVPEKITEDALTPDTREVASERFCKMRDFMLENVGRQIQPKELWELFPDDVTNGARRQAVAKFFKQLKKDPELGGRLEATGVTKSRRYVLQPDTTQHNPECTEIILSDTSDEGEDCITRPEVGISDGEQEGAAESSMVAKTDWGVEIYVNQHKQFSVHLDGSRIKMRSDSAALFARLIETDSILYEELFSQLKEESPDISERFISGMLHELHNFFDTYRDPALFQDKLINTPDGKKRQLMIRRAAKDFLSHSPADWSIEAAGHEELPQSIDGLREAQIPVMQSLLRYIDHKGTENLEGHIVAPTGSGKTVLFAKLLEHLRQENRLPPTLIVVPTKQLKEQTQSELRDKGFGGRIQLAETRNDHDSRADVVITTQNGFVRQLRSQGRSIDPTKIGLVIFDEAHHLQGEGTKEVMRDHLPHAGFIGFTATPDYDHKRMLHKLLPDLIHEISVHEAVDEGLIAPYRTILLPTHADLSSVVPVGKEYHQYLLNRAIDTSTRNLLITRFIADSLAGQRTVVNVNTVEHAETMAELLRQHGVSAMAVKGGMKYLDQVLKAFSEGEIEKIIHAKLLTEGFDEPKVEAVVNIAPTLSIVREKQRVGRGQRIDPTNPDKVLTIVECVDESYTRKPRFYGADDMTGEWRYGIGSEQDIEVHPAYAAMQNPEVLQSWWAGNSSLGSLPESAEELPEITYQPVPKKIFHQYLKTRTNKDRDSDDGHLGYKTSIARTSTEQSVSSLRTRRIQEAESLEDGHTVDIRTVRTETDAVAEYLLQSDELDSLTITSNNEVRQLQLALKLLHGRYGKKAKTSDEDSSDSGEVVLPQQVKSIFHAVNNAIAAYGGSDMPVVGPDVHKRPKPSAKAIETSVIASRVMPLELKESKAACKDVDPEIMFPERGESTKPAKSICSNCSIKEPCLHYALITGEKFGVWGGTSERERRRMRQTGIVGQIIARYTAVDAVEEIEALAIAD